MNYDKLNSELHRIITESNYYYLDYLHYTKESITREEYYKHRKRNEQVLREMDKWLWTLEREKQDAL
ncbi:MAG: hypothetical protein R2685_11085 [Candidatus Nitrosocosmicus sp.]|nr:hypothetical protein [Candidatus Nitrosocosmicus sp.]